jgi:hypothetical protein
MTVVSHALNARLPVRPTASLSSWVARPSGMKRCMSAFSTMTRNCAIEGKGATFRAGLGFRLMEPYSVSSTLPGK